MFLFFVLLLCFVFVVVQDQVLSDQVLLCHFDKIFAQEAAGVIMSEGKTWQEQRRFTLKSLKDLGFGRNKLDTIIHEEVNILIEDLILRSGAGDVLIDDIFNFPIVNIL